MNYELAMGVEWGVFRRLEWTQVNSCSSRRWEPTRTFGFFRTWRKRSQSSLQWCGRTCSVHAVSILWVSCWRLPEFPELSLRRFIFNEWRKKEHMLIICSLWRIPFLCRCRSSSRLERSSSLKVIWRLSSEKAQCTSQRNGSEWIAIQQNHVCPGWLLLHCARGQIRNFRAWGRVRFGIYFGICLLCCIPLSLFRPLSFPDPTHTGLLNDVFAQVELSRIPGYTYMCHPAPISCFEDSWRILKAYVISLCLQDRLQGTTVMKGPTNSVVQSSLSPSGHDKHWKPMQHHATTYD